jgi:hypothetical protein
MLAALHHLCRKKISYGNKARAVQLKNSKYNTYDARRSKYSISSARTGALPAAAELDEASLSIRFLFLSTPASSTSAGGGDVDELVSSSDSSASSPS